MLLCYVEQLKRSFDGLFDIVNIHYVTSRQHSDSIHAQHWTDTELLHCFLHRVCGPIDKYLLQYAADTSSN